MFLYVDLFFLFVIMVQHEQLMKYSTKVEYGFFKSLCIAMYLAGSTTCTKNPRLRRPIHPLWTGGVEMKVFYFKIVYC